MTIHDSGGNYTNLVQQQHDEDNNLLSCPKCGSTHLIKKGRDSKTQGQPQRYQCSECGHKTVHPKKCMNYEVDNPFTEEEIPTDELIQQRIDVFNRKEKRENNEEFLNIKIKDDKPIGLYICGDPHIDDDGCDMPSLIKHMDITNKTDGMFACNVGDLQNNWARRTKLAGLWAEQSTTSTQAFQLTEWLIRYTDWLFIVAGNHDMWSGDGDFQAAGAHWQLRNRLLSNQEQSNREQNITSMQGRQYWQLQHGRKIRLVRNITAWGPEESGGLCKLHFSLLPHIFYMAFHCLRWCYSD